MKSTKYHEVILTVNEQRHLVVIKSNAILLHTLREQVGLTGAKGGCENGDCGACTVLIDGQPRKSCMMLTIEVNNRSITTIEGLKDTEIQEAFINFNGFQCGYCTSGFLLNAHALLQNNPHATDSEKRTWLNSNLCRCTGYEGIRDAFNSAQQLTLDKKS